MSWWRPAALWGTAALTPDQGDRSRKPRVTASAGGQSLPAMLSQGGCRSLRRCHGSLLTESVKRRGSRTRRACCRLIEGGNRLLRSSAEHLRDEELLDKLRGFGFDLDRRSLEQLCESALSAEEVARPLMGSCGFRNDSERMQGTGSGSEATCFFAKDLQPLRDGFPIPHARGRVSPAQELLGSA